MDLYLFLIFASVFVLGAVTGALLVYSLASLHALDRVSDETIRRIELRQKKEG